MSLPPRVWFVEIREDDGSTSEDAFEQMQAALPIVAGQVITTVRQQRHVRIEEITESDPPPKHVGRIVARPFVARSKRR